MTGTAAPALRSALRPRTPQAPLSFAAAAGPQPPGAAGYAPPPPVQQARNAAITATANVQNAPNRQQLAASALQLARDTTQEGYQTSLRDVARAAAATGRLGSGDTTERLADVAMRRERDLDQLARSVSLDAAANEQSDLLARAGAANTLAGLLGSETRADEGVGMERSRLALDTELGRGSLGLERDRLTQQGQLTREGYDLTRSESAAERALRGALQTQSLDFQGQESLADRILRGALQTQNLTFQGQEGAAERSNQRYLQGIQQILSSAILAGKLDPEVARKLGINLDVKVDDPPPPPPPSNERPRPGNPGGPLLDDPDAGGAPRGAFDVANISGGPSRNVLGGGGTGGMIGNTSPQYVAPTLTYGSTGPLGGGSSSRNAPVPLSTFLGGNAGGGSASRPLSITDLLTGGGRPSTGNTGSTGSTPTVPVYRPPVIGQNTQGGSNLWTPPGTGAGRGVPTFQQFAEEYAITPQDPRTGEVITDVPVAQPDPRTDPDGFDRWWELRRAGWVPNAEGTGWVTPQTFQEMAQAPQVEGDYQAALARLLSPTTGFVPPEYQALVDAGEGRADFWNDPEYVRMAEAYARQTTTPPAGSFRPRFTTGG